MLPLIAVLSAAWIDVDPVTCTIRGKFVEIMLTGTKQIKKSHLPLPGMHCACIQVSAPANEHNHFKQIKAAYIIVFTSSMIFRRLLMGSIDEAGCGHRGDKVKTMQLIFKMSWVFLFVCFFHIKPIDNQLVIKQQSGQMCLKMTLRRWSASHSL